MLSGRCAPVLFLAAMLSPVPAAAQSNRVAEVPPAPAPREDTVGPEQLRDFSLPGTVTRRPEQPAERPRPAVPAPQSERRPDGSAATAARPAAPPRSRVSASVPAPAATDGAEEPATRPVIVPAPSLSVELPPPTATDQTGTGLPEPLSSLPPALPDTGAAPLGNDTQPLWPWLIALGLAALAGALWIRRRRSEPEEEAGPELAFAGALAPAPSPPAPRPAPAPPPLRPASESPRVPAADPKAAPASAGIVSTRLRPWIDLEFGPLRTVLSDTEATVEFDLLIVNSGSMPARQVVVEAVILNAGADQEGELAAFFARPDVPGEGIDVVAPLTRVPVRSQVRLRRDAVREYGVEGRRVFIPIVAFNAAYRWGGGTGRTSASFLVGRGAPGAEKLAPFRVDQGPREWRDLQARLLGDGVRR